MTPTACATSGGGSAPGTPALAAGGSKSHLRWPSRPKAVSRRVSRQGPCGINGDPPLRGTHLFLVPLTARAPAEAKGFRKNCCEHAL